MKPILVGEDNPTGGGDRFALYPVPEGRAGWRLCCLIFGMWRKDYIDAFDRCNLVQGKWSLAAARERAGQLAAPAAIGRRLILCGSKVCSAFHTTFDPFRIRSGMLILPHPSGRNRFWNYPDSIKCAREALATFVPEVADMIGNYDHLIQAELPEVKP